MIADENSHGSGMKENNIAIRSTKSDEFGARIPIVGKHVKAKMWTHIVPSVFDRVPRGGN